MPGIVVPLVQGAMTVKSPSWCPVPLFFNAYGPITSTQTSLMMPFIYGVASTQQITQFSAVQLCGATTPSQFTYLKVTNAYPFISVDTTTGAISVSASSSIGTYQINV